MEQLNPDLAQALSKFSDSATPPDERRAALSFLISSKFLPKQADDSAIEAGRSHLLVHATSQEGPPAYRLLSIAESIRLGQVVKRWLSEISEQLQPAFERELPPMQLLSDADDRLNLARACALMNSPWLPDYLAKSIADEETGEKARVEIISALLTRVSSLETVFQQLASAFKALRPTTEAPGDTIARRISRTLSALRGALLEAELDAGEAPGKALLEMVSLPLSALGKPQEEKVQIDLAREALLTVHDVVRTRISVVVDPQMYSVVTYCRKLSEGSSWPSELAKPLEKLITDVSEALLLLGRQGQCDQALLSQLDVLCNHPNRARAIAKNLASKHPELPEQVRDWLEKGRARTVRSASESAIEAAASNADQSIGSALHAARQVRTMRDNLHDVLISNLEIYEPNIASLTKDLLDRVQILAVQVEQAASLRSLDLYGKPGEEIEMSPKYFTVIGNEHRQYMTVKQPAIVRIRADGSRGDAVAKGIVE